MDTKKISFFRAFVIANSITLLLLLPVCSMATIIDVHYLSHVPYYFRLLPNFVLTMSGCIFYNFMWGLLLGYVVIKSIKTCHFYYIIPWLMALIFFISAYSGDCMWFWNWLANFICPEKNGTIYHAAWWIYPEVKDILIRWQIVR